MWTYQGEHLGGALPARPDLQIPGDRREQDRGQRGPAEREHQPGGGRGQPSQVRHSESAVQWNHQTVHRLQTSRFSAQISQMAAHN